MPAEGEEGTQHEFPHAERCEEEGCLGPQKYRDDERDQRGQADRGRDVDEPMRPPSDSQEEQRGGEDVVLLLDRQGPGVQERLEVGGTVEVADLLEEEEIRNEERGIPEALAELRDIPRQHQQHCSQRARQIDDQESRHDAPGAAVVEAGEGEASCLDVVGDEAGDQETGDDEEDVDADEAAAEPRHLGVEQDDDEHGNRSQAVDVPAVVHERRSRRPSLVGRVWHVELAWPTSLNAESQRLA